MRKLSTLWALFLLAYSFYVSVAKTEDFTGNGVNTDGKRITEDHDEEEKFKGFFHPKPFSKKPLKPFPPEATVVEKPLPIPLFKPIPKSIPIVKPIPNPTPIVKPIPKPIPMVKPFPKPISIVKPIPKPVPVVKPIPKPIPIEKLIPKPFPIVKPLPKPFPKPFPPKEFP